MALIDNLIAFWELEESSGQRNDAHGSNHLTDNNTATSNTGKVGTCGQFTAANNEYLTCADNADLSTGDIDYTIACWVYLDSKSTYRTIACKYGDTFNVNREWILIYRSDVDRYRFGVAGAAVLLEVEAENFGSPATGAWHFIVAWHDAANDQIGISVNDGTPDTDAWASGSIDGTAQFELGTSTNLALPFDGRIDQFGFWKRVLTSGERTQLYNSGNGLSYAAMSGGGGDLSALIGEPISGSSVLN